MHVWYVKVLVKYEKPQSPPSFYLISGTSKNNWLVAIKSYINSFLNELWMQWVAMLSKC